MTREEKLTRRREYRQRPEVKVRRREYQQQRQQDPALKCRANEWQRQWRKNNPVPRMLSVARGRARDAGIPFDLCPEDVIIPEFCPILGIKLERGEGVCTTNSPSLDKVIPLLGYVKGNVQVISMKANAMKQAASMDELIMLGEWAKLEKTRRSDA